MMERKSWLERKSNKQNKKNYDFVYTVAGKARRQVYHASCRSSRCKHDVAFTITCWFWSTSSNCTYYNKFDFWL